VKDDTRSFVADVSYVRQSKAENPVSTKQIVNDAVRIVNQDG